jgi:hypothetical protein
MAKKTEVSEQELLEASLELLECRKLRNRFVYCMACNEEMRPASLNICAECLDDECNIFYNNALDDDEEE